MLKASWSGLLVLILMFSSVKVRAQDAETIADIRCVIVGMKFVVTAPAAQQSAGTMLSLYYMGKLNGRRPNQDIEDLVVKELSLMTSLDYSSESKRCGAALTEKGREITQLGKNIAERVH